MQPEEGCHVDRTALGPPWKAALESGTLLSSLGQKGWSTPDPLPGITRHFPWPRPSVSQPSICTRQVHHPSLAGLWFMASLLPQRADQTNSTIKQTTKQMVRV